MCDADVPPKKKVGYAAVTCTQWRPLSYNDWTFSITEAPSKWVVMLSWIVQLTTFNQLKSTCKEDFQQSFLSPKSPVLKGSCQWKCFLRLRTKSLSFFLFLLLLEEKKKSPVSCLLGRFFLFLSLKGYFFPSHFADDISTHTKSLVLGIVPK